MAQVTPGDEAKSCVPDADQKTQNLCYRPLDREGRQIRVLDAEASQLDSTVHCSLRHVNLDDTLNYAALSYYWGAPAIGLVQPTLQIENVSVVVRPSLYAFVHQLGRRYKHFTIWVDNICIDQSNLQERGSQVALMGEIYSLAREVYAWLGEADADSDYAFEAFSHGTIDLRSKDVDMMLLTSCADSVLNRPYWQRMWIIQELVMARKVTLLCGNKDLSLEDFKTGVTELLSDIDNAEPLRIRPMSFERLIELERTRASLTHTEEDNPFQNDLFQLMDTYWASRCADDRDKIYALLAMAPDGRHVRPDYTLSKGDLFFHLLSLSPPLSKMPICANRMSRHREINRRAKLEVAVRVRKCLAISALEVATSLKPQQSDKLYSWSRFEGTIKITSGTSFRKAIHKLKPRHDSESESWSEYAVDGYPQELICSKAKDLHHGDHVYRLTEAYGGPSTYIADLLLVYRPGNSIFHDLAVTKKSAGRFSSKDFDLLRKLCLPGITICKNSPDIDTTECPRQKQSNLDFPQLLLVHLSRVVFCVSMSVGYNGFETELFSGVDSSILSVAPTCDCKLERKHDCVSDQTSRGSFSWDTSDWSCFCPFDADNFLRPVHQRTALPRADLIPLRTLHLYNNKVNKGSLSEDVS